MLLQEQGAWLHDLVVTRWSRST